MRNSSLFNYLIPLIKLRGSKILNPTDFFGAGDLDQFYASIPSTNINKGFGMYFKA